MEEYVKIKKNDIIEIIWGIYLSDHLGDVWNEINPLIKLLGIKEDLYGGDLLDKMKEMDLIPDYQRD